MTKKSEQSSARIAHIASNVLRSPTASRAAKSLAGSALAQANTSKQTSAPVASKAAKVLDDGRAGRATRSLAGSVLTQKGK